MNDKKELNFAEAFAKVEEEIIAGIKSKAEHEEMATKRIADCEKTIAECNAKMLQCDVFTVSGKTEYSKLESMKASAESDKRMYSEFINAAKVIRPNTRAEEVKAELDALQKQALEEAAAEIGYHVRNACMCFCNVYDVVRKADNLKYRYHNNVCSFVEYDGTNADGTPKYRKQHLSNSMDSVILNFMNTVAMHGFIHDNMPNVYMMAYKGWELPEAEQEAE